MIIQIQPIVRQQVEVAIDPRKQPIKKASAVNPALFEKRLANGIYKIDDGELNKRCSKCHEYWPADTEFFHSQNADDGLHTWCKACHAESHNLRKTDLSRAKAIVSQVKKS